MADDGNHLFWFPGFTHGEKVLQLLLTFWFRNFAYPTDAVRAKSKEKCNRLHEANEIS